MKPFLLALTEKRTTTENCASDTVSGLQALPVRIK